MRRLAPSLLLLALFSSMALLPEKAMAAALPNCSQLASDAAFGLKDNPGVTNLSVSAVPSGPGVSNAYCRVEFTYNSGKGGPADGYDVGQKQAIGIRIGLPLRSDDGGTGAWNRKIQNMGGGGCMGLHYQDVSVATNKGYVGTTTDGGHKGAATFDCSFAIISSGPLANTLNLGLIRDFAHDHLLWQTRWSKTLTSSYYGKPQTRTYWTGCSQGGREANIIAGQFADEYDGILAGAPALYSSQFQTAQAWSGLVVKDKLKRIGKDLNAAQVQAAVQLEIAACDAMDGVKDGVLGDPRTCQWSAVNAICGKPGAVAPPNCLDADQAAAFDLIRQGPQNSSGRRIWYPWEPGTLVPVNTTSYLVAQSVMQWALANPKWSSDAHLYLDRKALAASGDPLGITYEDMTEFTASRVGPLVDWFDPALLGQARAKGVKMLSWHGTADRNIMSRNSIKYYRELAAGFGKGVSDPDVQSWYRLFLYPGVAHCGGGVGPQPGDQNAGPLFDALVNWVENGAAPERIIATRNLDGGVVETRPVCSYPKTAIYQGSGSVHDAASFACGGNLETKQTICSGVVTQYRKQTRNVRANLVPDDGTACDEQAGALAN